MIPDEAEALKCHEEMVVGFWKNNSDYADTVRSHADEVVSPDLCNYEDFLQLAIEGLSVKKLKLEKMEMENRFIPEALKTVKEEMRKQEETLNECNRDYIAYNWHRTDPNFLRFKSLFQNELKEEELKIRKNILSLKKIYEGYF